MNASNENGSTAGKWLLTAGLAVGALAGYMHSTNDQKDMASHEAVNAAPSQEPSLQRQLNTDLKDTANRAQLKKETMQEDNAGADSLSNTDFEQDGSAPIPLVLQQQNNAKDVAHDEMPKAFQPMTPDQRVSLMLQRNQWLKDYDQAYQQEYIRQFLKNAREHGVNVRLNKNLDVTGLSVNRSNQPILFRTSPTSTK